MSGAQRLIVEVLESPARQKSAFLRRGPYATQRLRRLVQLSFLALNVWIGHEFLFYVRFYETAGRTNDRIERDLKEMYAAIHAHGARVVAITVAPWGGFTRYFTPHRAESTRALGRFILEQRTRGLVDVAVDAFALLSCGDPDRLCERYDRARSDGLHFGKGGHDVLGQALYDAEFKACR